MPIILSTTTYVGRRKVLFSQASVVLFGGRRGDKVCPVQEGGRVLKPNDPTPPSARSCVGGGGGRGYLNQETPRRIGLL